MYEAFYHFHRTPFSKTPDPSFLYMSRGHEEALARLLYAVEEREFVVLTGEVGCGKTTITRALIDSLGEGYQIVLILNPCLSPTQFLKTIARRLELDTAIKQRDEIIDLMYEKVYGLNERGVTPVIIIDEAHLIPKRETFEEVRLLTNFQLDDRNLVSIVLAGQPGLRTMIMRDDFKALKQRIGLFYNLDPLSEHETGEYIRHRLALSGGDKKLFTDAAVALMFRSTGGIPRLINSLATTALLEGFGKGAAVIDDAIIVEAARELMLTIPESASPVTDPVAH